MNRELSVGHYLPFARSMKGVVYPDFMISLLRGRVRGCFGSMACIEVHGVGYEVQCSTALISRIEADSELVVVVHTDVREDAIRLYGFADELERQVFRLLLKVSGIGAKTASDIISSVEKVELLRIIGNSDLTQLQKIKGVGKKTAERIVLELRDRVAELVPERSSLPNAVRGAQAAFRDAVDALVALGFPRQSAETAVAKVENGNNLEAGEVVREALRHV